MADDIEKALNYIDNHFKKTDGFEGVEQTIRKALENTKEKPYSPCGENGLK